jgi:endogenous inhibitor of DNA gyrase (YacG/DUF329 family)
MSRVRCPTCDELFDPDDSPGMPFCSQRCKNVDLGRWLDEKYGMPYEADDDSQGPESDSPPSEGQGSGK